MAKFTELIAYFKTLATKHKSILHTETEKHFFRMEIDEVLEGINRSDAAYPMFVLEGYGFSFTDNRSDNLLKKRTGAFILIDHLQDISDHDRIHEIWDEMEQIATDILVKIKADKRDRLVPVVRDFDFESVDASLILNEIGNDVGIRISYSLGSPVSNDVDPSRWLSFVEDVIP